MINAESQTATFKPGQAQGGGGRSTSSKVKALLSVVALLQRFRLGSLNVVTSLLTQVWT